MNIEPISAQTALFIARHWHPADHRELTRLSPTTDSARYFRRDPIASAMDAGSMPTQGFRPTSNSVKDCRLTAGTAIRPRSKSRVGVTGGYVEDADRKIAVDASWAIVKAPILKVGKNARKRALRARNA